MVLFTYWDTVSLHKIDWYYEIIIYLLWYNQEIYDNIELFWIVIVTRLTRQMPLVEQELLTLPEHLSSPPVFSGFMLLDL